ncbi:MAG TPA: MCE family protein [Nocardioides sp.]|nr:MCE family protein [Nocardioides sp.]
MKILQSHKLLGVIFLALLLAGVWFTNAIFNKSFTDYEEVKLQTSKIGLQLPARADVKIRGVIVGEVLEFDSNTEGAELTLGIFPSQIDTIPENVTGSIVPKTLFGEKYVSLEVPEDPSPEHLEANDVITRTVISTEVEQVLSDLYPLLRTVQPADLNMTLNALATALEGRGEQLGENLETVDSYLKRLNPQIPALVEDLRLTARVSGTYADVLPEVAQILDDSITTTGTLEAREAQLQALFTDVASFSDTARTFLAQNGDNLVRLGEVSAAQLRVLSRYSTEFPCLTEALVNVGKLEAEAFRGFMLHIVLETLPRQPRHYGPQDQPRFDDDRGPNCLHLPNPPWSQANPVTKQPDFNDGIDEPTNKGTSRVAPQYAGLAYDASPQDAAWLREYLRATGTDDSDLGVLLAGPFVGEAQR